MTEPLTPPPILNAIAEQPGLTTPRVWARFFTALQQHAGTPGPQGEQGPQGDPATGPSDEHIQDLMATTMNNSSRIQWTYNDTFNYLSCDIFGSSIGAEQLGNDQVTYAKIQNVSDNRLLGRSAGSAGDVQELTTGAGLTLAGGVLSATTTYEEGTFTVTATGFTTVVSGTARYVRVGKQVTVTLPETTLVGTSNATTMTLTGIPAALVSAGTHAFACVGQDNGATTSTPVVLRVNAGATTWDTYAAFSLTAWTATGGKGMFWGVVQYLLP